MANGSNGDQQAQAARIKQLEAECAQLRKQQAEKTDADGQVHTKRLAEADFVEDEALRAEHTALVQAAEVAERGVHEHPDNQFFREQVAHFKEGAAAALLKLHASWSPPRKELLAERQLRDAEEASKKAATAREAAEEHLRLAQEGATAKREAERKAEDKVTELRVELEAAQRAATAARGAAEAAPADAPEAGKRQKLGRVDVVPTSSWQDYQQRVSYLCRTGLPPEEAMQLAASEAASPEGLRLGPADDIELDDRPTDESDFEDDDDDAMFDEYAGSAAAEATITRAQLREILTKQTGRVKAAVKAKRRKPVSSPASGSVRQPAFSKK